MSLEKNFNIDIERLISKIDDTKKELEDLKNNNDKTEDVRLLEMKLTVLKEELNDKTSSLDDFKNLFLNDLKEMYSISSKIKRNKEKIESLSGGFSKYRTISMNISITIFLISFITY